MTKNTRYFLHHNARACAWGFSSRFTKITAMAGRKNQGLFRLTAAKAAGGACFTEIDKMIEEVMAFRLPGEDADLESRRNRRNGLASAARRATALLRGNSDQIVLPASGFAKRPLSQSRRAVHGTANKGWKSAHRRSAKKALAGPSRNEKSKASKQCLTFCYNCILWNLACFCLV